MATEGIHFYKSLPFVTAVEVELGYPVIVSREMENGASHNFALAILGRENGRWYVYSNQLSPNDEMKTSNRLKDSYDNGTTIESVPQKCKMIEYYPPIEFDDFLNSVAAIPGTIVQHLAILKEKSLTVFIESSRNAVRAVDEMVARHRPFGGINSKVETFENRDGNGEIPFFIAYLKKNYHDFSNLELIKTGWKMGRKEFRDDVAGVFENEGIFRPKYFDDVSANLIANVNRGFIKGKSNFKVIDFSSEGKMIEFSVHSRWFGEFFTNVIRRYMGSFIFWAYSDGRGNLENYFIIDGRMKGEFLSGLGRHWQEPRRIRHHNFIDYLVKLSEVT